MNVLDIGANIGQYTFDFARAVAPGLVVAVEPTPKVAKELINATKDTENIRVHQIAFGDTCSIERVFNYGDWTLLKVDHADPRYQDKRWVHPSQRNDLKGEFITRFTTLDLFAGEASYDFVKIDVDGYEYRVVKGGMVWLKQHQPVIRIEVGQAGMRELGDSPKALLDLLRDLDYVFYSDTTHVTISDADILEAITREVGVRQLNTVDILCLPRQSQS